GFSV
ncbi:hypothetical protein CARUB_v100127392mg, partial [Capsella rubella]